MRRKTPSRKHRERDSYAVHTPFTLVFDGLGQAQDRVKYSLWDVEELNRAEGTKLASQGRGRGIFQSPTLTPTSPGLWERDFLRSDLHIHPEK